MNLHNYISHHWHWGNNTAVVMPLGQHNHMYSRCPEINPKQINANQTCAHFMGYNEKTNRPLKLIRYRWPTFCRHGSHGQQKINKMTPIYIMFKLEHVMSIFQLVQCTTEYSKVVIERKYFALKGMYRYQLLWIYAFLYFGRQIARMGSRIIPWHATRERGDVR